MEFTYTDKVWLVYKHERSSYPGAPPSSFVLSAWDDKETAQQELEAHRGKQAEEHVEAYYTLEEHTVLHRRPKEEREEHSQDFKDGWNECHKGAGYHWGRPEDYDKGFNACKDFYNSIETRLKWELVPELK